MKLEPKNYCSIVKNISNKMANINTITNCFGCGVCATACPKDIISIIQNREGFYVPYITNIDVCIDCGICLRVCSFVNEGLATESPKPIHSYAAWSQDASIRKQCSSGGIGFEIGRTLIANGYKVCGVRYDAEKGIAEHYISSSEEELKQTIGSKYIQSYTFNGFKAIDRKGKYLVTGTPCQIDSFRRYIRKFRIEDNFILLDFFCHAVPSMNAWRRYMEMVEKRIGKITYASWRNKFAGWHDSWVMSMNGSSTSDKISDNTEEQGMWNSRLSQGDIFYRLFLGDYCSNPACSRNCKFKYDRSSADIRIGDLWGNTYAANEDGVSAAVAFTKAGDAVLRQSGCMLIEHPFDVVAEGQMKKNVRPAYTSGIAVRLLRNANVPLDSIVWKLVFFTEKVLKFAERKTIKRKAR